MYCDGMPVAALSQHVVIASLFVGGKFALGMSVEIGAINAEDEHQQHLGIHARRTHVSRFQTIDRRCEHLLQLHGCSTIGD